MTIWFTLWKGTLVFLLFCAHVRALNAFCYMQNFLTSTRIAVTCFGSDFSLIFGKLKGIINNYKAKR